MATPAEKARDEALERVLSNSSSKFKRQVWELVGSLPSGMLVTGEDIRLMCEEEGIYAHHPNAWGGITNGLKGTLLIGTDKYRSMVTESSHARRTRVYRVV